MDFKVIFNLMVIAALAVVSFGVTLWLISFAFSVLALLVAVIVFLFPYALALIISVIVVMAVTAAIKSKGRKL